MKHRMFGDKPKERLIVSVEVKTVEAIDQLIMGRFMSGSRGEFVRLAIEEKLQRVRQL